MKKKKLNKLIKKTNREYDLSDAAWEGAVTGGQSVSGKQGGIFSLAVGMGIGAVCGAVEHSFRKGRQ